MGEMLHHELSVLQLGTLAGLTLLVASHLPRRPPPAPPGQCWRGAVPRPAANFLFSNCGPACRAVRPTHHPQHIPILNAEGAGGRIHFTSAIVDPSWALSRWCNISPINR